MAKWTGAEDTGKPVQTLMHSFLILFDTVLTLSMPSEPTAPESVRVAIDAAIQQHVLLLMGLDLPSQAAMTLG
jgi:hypothetical protein